MSTDSNSEEPTLKIPKSAHPVPTHQKLKTRNIPVLAYSAVSITLILALVIGAKSLGWYGTSGKVSATTGEAVELGPNSVGQDIKGWMTIQQVLDGFSLSKESLYSKFNIPASVATKTTVGSLSEEISTFELPALREWIDAKITQVKSDNAISIPTAIKTESPSATAHPESTSSSATFEVKGRTTIQEILEATFVTRKEFYKLFAIPDRIPTSTALNNIQTQGVDNFEVSAVRDWLDRLA
jgi:hypothetical protein